MAGANMMSQKPFNRVPGGITMKKSRAMTAAYRGKRSQQQSSHAANLGLSPTSVGTKSGNVGGVSSSMVVGGQLKRNADSQGHASKVATAYSNASRPLSKNRSAYPGQMQLAASKWTLKRSIENAGQTIHHSGGIFTPAAGNQRTQSAVPANYRGRKFNFRGVQGSFPSQDFESKKGMYATKKRIESDGV